MGEDLEALAEKGRDTGAARDAHEQARQDTQADYRRYLTERLVVRTFSRVHGSHALLAIVVAAVVAAAMFALISDTGSPGYVLLILAALGAGGGYVAHRFAEKRAVDAGIRWVESLPFGFAADAYLDGLSKQRMNTTVRVELVFSETVADGDRQLFSDACAGAVEVNERSWRSGRLILNSGELSTYFPSRGDSDSYYSNELVHRWVTQLVDRAVRTIHTRQPLTRVVIELS